MVLENLHSWTQSGLSGTVPSAVLMPRHQQETMALDCFGQAHQRASVAYEIKFGYASGRIDPFVGEKLRSKKENVCLIDRKVGSDHALFHLEPHSVKLREPEKLTLSRYLNRSEASGVSDGHLQMLMHLTALFSEGKHPAIIMLDEPEISLHPYALAVFAEAVKLAIKKQHKQIFIATHSPVLISQFALSDILAVEVGPSGQSVITQVDAISGIADLLQEYGAGALYMSELIAPQSTPLKDPQV